MKIRVYTNFKFKDEDYTFESVESLVHTEAEYRAEYMRLYGVAKARVKAFESSNMLRNKQYQAMKALKPQSKLKTTSQLANALITLKKSLQSEAGTVSGATQKNIEAVQHFNKLGYEFVNINNIYDFYDFLDSIKNSAYAKIYGSERLIDVFETAVDENVDTEDISAKFMRFMSESKQLPYKGKLAYEFVDWEKEIQA